MSLHASAMATSRRQRWRRRVHVSPELSGSLLASAGQSSSATERREAPRIISQDANVCRLCRARITAKLHNPVTRLQNDFERTASRCQGRPTFRRPVEDELQVLRPSREAVRLTSVGVESGLHAAGT